MLHRISVKPVSQEGWLFLLFLFIFVLIGLERGGGKISSFFEPLLGGFSIYLLFSRRASLCKVDGWLVSLFLIYCAYYLLRREGWSGPIDASIDYFRPVMQAILLVALLAWLVLRHENENGEMLFFVVAGAVIAGLSVFNFYLLSGNGLHERIRPLGEAEHPIIGMYYYAFSLILAGIILLRSKSSKSMLIALLCIGVLFLIFFLSRSRGPLLGLVVTTFLFLLFLMRGWRRWVLPLVAVALVAVFLFLMKEGWLARLDTGRFIIWHTVFDSVPKALWFGHGATTENYVYFSETYGWQHAHNIWLGHMYWGGVVGVMLLGMVCCRTAWLLWRCRGGTLSMLGLGLLCFGLVSMLTDGNLLLTYPGPVWMVFVVPVGLALGMSGRSKASSGKYAHHQADV